MLVTQQSRGSEERKGKTAGKERRRWFRRKMRQRMSEVSICWSPFHAEYDSLKKSEKVKKWGIGGVWKWNGKEAKRVKKSTVSEWRFHFDTTPPCLFISATVRPLQAGTQMPQTAVESGGGRRSGREREGQRERGRESFKQRLSDNAIYKAWPSASRINCALFWESRKLAGLQKEGDRVREKTKKIYSLFLSVPFVTHLRCLRVFHHHLPSKPETYEYDYGRWLQSKKLHEITCDLKSLLETNTSPRIFSTGIECRWSITQISNSYSKLTSHYCCLIQNEQHQYAHMDIYRAYLCACF